MPLPTAENLERLDAVIEGMLSTARIPGAAIAIVADGNTVFARGYGYRSLHPKRPLSVDTAYPIASTSKAINAMLLAMLVEEGRLRWDVPVVAYLPGFRLGNLNISAQVTLRDLLVMRTGLPRHDFVWLGNAITRAELVSGLQHLELAAGFRERFIYNNMTATAAGYIAEVVTGQSWEHLVQSRILEPLAMTHTGFGLPAQEDVTLSWHENSRRELVVTQRWTTEVTAPSGGALHSTVADMARWIAFNLAGGRIDDRALVAPEIVREIYAPQLAARTDPACPTPNAAYAMGWFVDTYRGSERISHGGYLHDVSSEVSLHPEQRIGIVSFINFGCPALARSLNQYAFDLIRGFENAQPFAAKLAEYEKKIADTRLKNASVPRVEGTSPSHDLDDYAGMYKHPAYGAVTIERHSGRLICRRHSLLLSLEHWHYDAWVVADNDQFVIHASHPFDRASRWLFEMDADGEIAALSIELESSAAPIRFVKQSVRRTRS